MVAILFYECKRMDSIYAETMKIRSVCRDINTIHRHITRLAIQEGIVITWEEEGYKECCVNCLCTDSLLQMLRTYFQEYIHLDQIDTPHYLLAEKKLHLFPIMQNIKCQKERKDVQMNLLPEVAGRKTRVHILEQEKEGIAGFPGRKEEIRIMPSPKELYALSNNLTAMQQQDAQENTCVDSLSMHDRTLNKALNKLINDFDKQTFLSFSKRKKKIEDTRNESSFRLSVITLSAAIALLFLSYLIMLREIKRNDRTKIKREELIERLQETIRQNEELMREQQNIMQTITHELRSPLSAISGYAEMIAIDEEGFLRIRHAETIRDASKRMAGMIDMLLNYFRLDSGKEIVRLLPFCLKSIVDTLETEFMPQMERKGLTFEIINEADEVVMGDRNLILRIGSNLLSNALKFTQKGTVKLTSKYSDGNFILTVEDTGTGMDKKNLEQIFKPFERLCNASMQDGFGLGLAIVKSLAELMGGNIIVESIPEKGSRFTVMLPLNKTDEIEKQPSSYITRQHLSGCSVLSIDNDRVILDMLHEMFKQSRIHCETCIDMSRLTEKLRENHYDLLTTDLQMSEFSGYDILELLRLSDIGNSRTIPVLTITGSGSVKEEELKQAGFSGVLLKPFSIDELLTAVEQCIDEDRTGYIDLTPLYAYGNKRHRLECLISETEKEMTGIREAMNNADKDKIDIWIHHIRSLWTLLKAEQPLQELYDAIHENRTMEEIQARARDVLAQGEKIIRLAKKEIGKTIWEK